MEVDKYGNEVKFNKDESSSFKSLKYLEELLIIIHFMNQ